MTEYSVPVWEKVMLTIEEASAYSNIGLNKLREICNYPDCTFVMHIGRRKLIKRQAFEDYVNRHHEL